MLLECTGEAESGLPVRGGGPELPESFGGGTK